MADYKKMYLRLLLTVLIVLQCSLASEEDDDDDNDVTCGFPGAPAYGYVKPDQEHYELGDTVRYSCRVGYILLGTSLSRCTEDGSWTEEVPICDESMTTLGIAVSTPALPGHSADMAIDRNRNTCTYLRPKQSRWWRIDLGGLHKVLSVAISMVTTDRPMKFTVYVVEIIGRSSSYKRCAAFEGKFGSHTMLHTCAEGKGLEGQRVHIDDHRLDDIFEICEVEVQVEKDTPYHCGRPDRRPFSMTENYEADDCEVEYQCKPGYQLIGDSTRECLASGQWEGEAPTCESIECGPLKPPENGELTYELVNGEDNPLEGSTAIYKCNYGYALEGDFTRVCGKDGSWSGKDPVCQVIRCPFPQGKHDGEIYTVQNKTNRVGSVAKLRCRKGVKVGEDPYITCTAAGEWTQPKAECLLRGGSPLKMKDSPKIGNYGTIVFGMVVAGIMVLAIAVAFFVVKRRREANKPELPSRQNDPLIPPPRPPPRGLKSALVDLVSRDSSGHKYDSTHLEDGEAPAAWKTRSLPLDTGINEGITDDMGAPRRTLSYDEPEKLASRGAGAESKREKEQEKEPEKRDTYAAVDYDRKRQSRMLKEQDSEERSQEASPTGAGQQLRELPPIPKEEEEDETRAQSAGTARSLSTDKEEKKGQDTEEAGSEESEDVSLPIAPSPASEAPTPSPDVVVENQVEGPSASPSTPTSDITPGRRRRRGPAAEQPSVEEVPETRRTRTRRRGEPEQPETPPPVAEQPSTEEVPESRRTRGRRRTEPEEPETPSPAAPAEEERPTRRTRQLGAGRFDTPDTTSQPSYTRRRY